MVAATKPSPNVAAAISPADFSDPVGFSQARKEEWDKVAGRLNPGNELLPALESIWITEWLTFHAERVGLAVKATLGLGEDELRTYIGKGGLKQCVADFRELNARAQAQRAEIAALKDAIRRIAEHRHEFAGRQTPEQMLEGIALKAFEALAYGRLPESVPSRGHEDAREDVALPEAERGAVAEAPPSPTDAAPGGLAPVEAPSQVLTAHRFAAMVGIRNLTKADGLAYASDGTSYDPDTPIDPESPLPAGVTHVVWKEYAAGGI